MEESVLIQVLQIQIVFYIRLVDLNECDRNKTRVF